MLATCLACHAKAHSDRLKLHCEKFGASLRTGLFYNHYMAIITVVELFALRCGVGKHSMVLGCEVMVLRRVAWPFDSECSY